MIKTFIILALLACTTCPVVAQTNDIKIHDNSVVNVKANDSVPLKSSQTTIEPVIQHNDLYLDHSLDSLHLPSLNSYGQALPLMHPLSFGTYWGGWNTWGLHKGLNISLGASVFAQFGKGAYHGAGFMQSISAMYALPLSKHLSVAVGGYFSNINWGQYNTQNVGLSAILGYQFNEKWEAYLYAQKNLTNGRMPIMSPTMYDYAELNDRIGAAVKYNFSPSFSVQLSVERGSSPAWNVPAPINNIPKPDNRQ